MRKTFSRRLAIVAMAGALAAPPAFAATARGSTGESYADTRAHVEDLISQYLWAFDTQDADAFASLFAKGGEVVMKGADIPEPIVFRGPEQLHAFVEMMRKRTEMPPHKDLQFSPNIHLPANLVLTVDGDKVTSKLYWFTVRRGANVDEIHKPNPDPAFFASLGRYEQEYVKQDGKWMFKRVIIEEMNKDTVAPPVPLSPRP